MVLQETKAPKKKGSKKRNPLVVGHTKDRRKLDKIESIGPPTQIVGSFKKVRFMHSFVLRTKIIWYQFDKFWQMFSFAKKFIFRKGPHRGIIFIPDLPKILNILILLMIRQGSTLRVSQNGPCVIPDPTMPNITIKMK